jgi:hypothetical protein
MHRADARALGIETSIRMKAMLDNGQRQQLMNMTPQGMYRHAASHMPMMQMMQMMRGGGMARCSRGAL